jgi:hypothetical protein
VSKNIDNSTFRKAKLKELILKLHAGDSQVLSLEKSCRALSRKVVPVLTLGRNLLSLFETTDFGQGGQLWQDEGRPQALLNASKSVSGGKQVKRIQKLQ